ncbi:MAG: hypothetical protein JXR25_02775 [Pontiellaceae bacterium]|nr:hypothetical protein [Pontiellaceae bacterium]MBN2783727.1 hypothetical protein [Pontiellaceae bacterium]
MKNIFLICWVSTLWFGLNQPMSRGGMADSWVATDALGRSLPDYRETGGRRSGKYVGVFYYVWVGNHTQSVYDLSRILKADAAERPWGPVHAFHFGAEPEYGYYHSADPWVLRRDMQMLANADVDFIYIDLSNAVLYESTVTELLGVIKQMRAEGIAAPKVVFMTNASSGKSINALYDRFYTNPLYEDLWFEWGGRPLILGHIKDPELRRELVDYFTIKYSWAWTNAKADPDHWQWLDTYPQDYGWHRDPDHPEQIPVGTASHPSNSQGKSFHDGRQPAVGADYTTDYTPYGLHFEEQWVRAHEVDPEVVMITQWNEWIAQRFIKPDQAGLFAGRPPLQDGSWFVDVFSPEFCRDIAPMHGGYTDNYYYQMIGHIRRFKGLSAPIARPQPREIRIDGRFKDWDGIPVVYQDPPGDTMHRSFRGTDPATIYTNTFGRNDIISCSVVEGRRQVCFRVCTVDVLTPRAGDRWMVLLIDCDQDKETGWEGYDLAVNWRSVSESKTSYAVWSEGQWNEGGEVSFGYRENQLELGVPKRLFSRGVGAGFDFKWVDNVSLDSVESLFLEGDVAPDRRFNYRY